MKWYLASLLVVSFFSFKAESIEKITIALENNRPPMAKFNGKGTARDKIIKLMPLVDFEIDNLVLSHALAVHFARTGKIHAVAPLEKTKANKAVLTFSQQPLLVEQMAFYYPKQSKLSFNDFAEIPDGTSIAVLQGEDYNAEYVAHRHRFKETRVSSTFQIIQLLQKGKIDASIMLDSEVQYHLQKAEQEINTIKRGQVIYLLPLYIAFSKNKGDIQGLMDKVDKALLQINSE